MNHIPVLLDCVINFLAPKPGGIYVDCTFGNGGYSRKILQSGPSTKVIAIDQDPLVEPIAQQLANEYNNRFSFIRGNFSNLKNLIPIPVDGIVWDLGVSSMQLDNAERGFSFSKDAMLDMRMSSQGQLAADFINQASYDTLADVIYHNGDEHCARKIAQKIISERVKSPINTTKQLADLVRSVVKTRNYSIDPATKTFQAIRIFINDELGALRNSLLNVEQLLKAGGRLVWVSFHSLEDSIIKDYLKANSAKKIAVSKYHKVLPLEGIYKVLTSKPTTPSSHEVGLNPRARSAKLRAAEKIIDGQGYVINE